MIDTRDSNIGIKLMKSFFSVITGIIQESFGQFILGLWGGLVAFDMFLNDSRWNLLLLGSTEGSAASWIIFIFNLNAILHFCLLIVGLFVGTPLSIMSEIIRIFKLGLKVDKEDK